MKHIHQDIIKQIEHESQQHTSKESVRKLTALRVFDIAVTLQKPRVLFDVCHAHSGLRVRYQNPLQQP